MKEEGRHNLCARKFDVGIVTRRYIDVFACVVCFGRFLTVSLFPRYLDVSYAFRPTRIRNSDVFCQKSRSVARLGHPGRSHVVSTWCRVHGQRDFSSIAFSNNDPA